MLYKSDDWIQCIYRTTGQHIHPVYVFCTKGAKEIISFNSRCFLNLAAHLPFATVHVPFLINTMALLYNFGKSWKSDPGIIKASEEQKKKVKLLCCLPLFSKSELAKFRRVYSVVS